MIGRWTCLTGQERFLDLRMARELFAVSVAALAAPSPRDDWATGRPGRRAGVAADNRDEPGSPEERATASGPVAEPEGVKAGGVA